MPTGKYERTAEHRERISKGLKGKRPKNLDQLHEQRRGKPLDSISDEKNVNWKGDAVGYTALHAWVKRRLGAPKLCARCGTTTARRYEWANKSREYKRDLSDWERLCTSCHRKAGYESGEYVTWNKGRSIQTNTGKTHIKPGQHLSPKNEFQPGLIPHNKYLEPRTCPTCGEQFQPLDSTRKYCSRKCYWASLRK